MEPTNYSKLEEAYFGWLVSMLPGWKDSHSRLLRQLYETDFHYQLWNDGNRLSDGIGLRARYCWEHGNDPEMRAALKLLRPCSVLEVMIAMGIRCEEEFMTLYTEEELIERWVGPMIRALELDTYDDGNYDAGTVNAAVQAMMARQYDPDGRGSLFYIPGIREDMRNIDLWEQMMAWIEFYQKHGGKSV